MPKAAKKRKGDEDEEFKFPEFDEGEYLRKEIDLAKVTFVTIALSVGVAVLLFAMALEGLAVFAFLLGLVVTFALPRLLKVLPWPKIDLKRLERRDWFGQGAVFLFSWLAFWILLLNVPFADVTPPKVQGVTAANGVRTVSLINDPNQTVLQQIEGPKVWVNVTVFENSNDLSLTISVNNTNVEWTRVPNAPTYSFTLLGKAAYLIAITASDGAGHVADFRLKLTVF